MSMHPEFGESHNPIREFRTRLGDSECVVFEPELIFDNTPDENGRNKLQIYFEKFVNQPVEFIEIESEKKLILNAHDESDEEYGTSYFAQLKFNPDLVDGYSSSDAIIDGLIGSNDSFQIGGLTLNRIDISNVIEVRYATAHYLIHVVAEGEQTVVQISNCLEVPDVDRDGVIARAHLPKSGEISEEEMLEGFLKTFMYTMNVSPLAAYSSNHQANFPNFPPQLYEFNSLESHVANELFDDPELKNHNFARFEESMRQSYAITDLDFPAKRKEDPCTETFAEKLHILPGINKIERQYLENLAFEFQASTTEDPLELRGVMLYGRDEEPRMEKIAHVFANSIGAEFNTVEARRLLGRASLKNTKRIREYFEDISWEDKPVVAYMRNFEDVFGRVGETHGGLRTFAQVMQQSLQKKHNLFVFASAESEKSIPMSFWREGVFDRGIEITPPSGKERKGLIVATVAEIIVADALRPGDSYFSTDHKIDFNNLTKLTKNYSASEIQSAIHKVKVAKFNQRTRNRKPAPILTDDIIRALGKNT